jgi:predicted Zn-dependent peptidase
MGLTWRLTSSKAMTGNWRYFIDSYHARKKVTAEDVMRVVNKYLTKNNRTVAYIVKSGDKKSDESSDNSG